MTRVSSLWSLLAASTSVLFAACGGTSSFTLPGDGMTGAPAPVTGTSAPDAGTPDQPTPASDDAGASASDAGLEGTDATAALPDAAVGDAEPAPIYPTPLPGPTDAASILGSLQTITANCVVASNGKYATDRSASAAVDICKLNGAFFWTADMAIDCDGQKTTECSTTTDSTFSAQTSVVQSNGQPLIASELPYVVIPLPSTRFDYTKENIQPGALAIVLYENQVVYGVFGDEGPTGVIGEASYAMAKSLGLNPSPNSGGTSGKVTYIVLTGKGAVVTPVENHTSAVTLSGTLVPQLIANN
jgi:hypothetical protein